MSVRIQVGGLKGAVPKLLRTETLRTLDQVADLLTPEETECIEALRIAANKLVSRAPQGKRVDVQLLFSDAPFGGCEMAVAVTASRPRSR